MSKKSNAIYSEWELYFTEKAYDYLIFEYRFPNKQGTFQNLKSLSPEYLKAYTTLWKDLKKSKSKIDMIGDWIWPKMFFFQSPASIFLEWLESEILFHQKAMLSKPKKRGKRSLPDDLMLSILFILNHCKVHTELYPKVRLFLMEGGGFYKWYYKNFDVKIPWHLPSLNESLIKNSWAAKLKENVIRQLLNLRLGKSFRAISIKDKKVLQKKLENFEIQYQKGGSRWGKSDLSTKVKESALKILDRKSKYGDRD